VIVDVAGVSLDMEVKVVIFKSIVPEISSSMELFPSKLTSAVSAEVTELLASVVMEFQTPERFMTDAEFVEVMELVATLVATLITAKTALNTEKVAFGAIPPTFVSTKHYQELHTVPLNPSFQFLETAQASGIN